MLVAQPSKKSEPQAGAKRRAKYRDGTNEWSGCGTMPAWTKLKGDALESFQLA
ncbi:H-NS histone family protein [Bradyrhizobium sp. WSM 1791]|uniref:H-NS histone family protein n=1 Tax=Bradyrhizobium australiense TaxID=2721161 RepID=A0A7Y4LVQ7_9BRAD|nr:H-NS histone family protein [Bradyrhizobium australiense]